MLDSARRVTLALLLLATGAVALGQDAPLAWRDGERATLARLRAGVRRDARGFYSVEGERFVVRSDIGEEFATECALYLDGFATLFSELVSGPVAWELKPEAIVFSTERAFRTRTGRRGRGFSPYRHDGAGRALELSVMTYADGDVERQLSSFYRPILHHEGAHALLRRHVGARTIPPWFDEGLATFLQFVDPRAPRERAWVERDARSQFLCRLEADVNGGRLMTLRELLGKTRAGWEPDPDAGTHNEFGPLTMRNYAYAESFMSFLLGRGAGGRRLLGSALDAIREGRDLAAELGEDRLAGLERAWHEKLPDQVRARARAGRTFVEARTATPSR